MAYKVYIFAGAHPIYRTLVEYPPDGEFEVVSNISRDAFAQDRLRVYSSARNYVRRIHEVVSEIFGVPRVFVPPPGYDVIHSTRGFIPLTKTPTVIDIEIGTSFTSFSLTAARRGRWLIRRLLSRESVKYILPHSRAAMKSFQSLFGREFDGKLKVVYPAAPVLPCRSAVGRHDSFTILFVGRDAVSKGGIELYMAFKHLRREYKNVQLVMKTDPNTLPSSALRDPHVRIIGDMLTYDDVLRLYCNADIFVMPTHMDSFGYVYLEAMAAGLPLIGTNQFAVPEIIDDGRNGFVISTTLRSHDDNYLPVYTNPYDYRERERLAKEIAQKIALLIEDRHLLRKMADYSYYLATEGRFSVKYRNEQLRRVYLTAVGD